MKNTKQV